MHRRRQRYAGRHRKPAERRSFALTSAVGTALAAALTFAGTAGPAAGTPPPRPAPTDVAQAQAAARRAARHVAQVHDSLRRTSREVAAAAQAADHAQAEFSAQLGIEGAAADRVRVADDQVAAARTAYERDHEAFVRLVASMYESGGVGEVGSMLVAASPSSVLAAAETRQMVADQQAVVVSRAQSATDTYRAAQQRRQAALDAERRATAAVGALRDQAELALRVAQATLGSLHNRLVEARTSRAEADKILSSFLGGWALADPARADALNRHYLEQAQTRAASEHPARRGPAWTAAMGETVALRALLQIGIPYAWAGGNAAGPTTGVCAAGAAHNDCRLSGFDCSGLALYSWARYLALPHLASSQYTVAGRSHPDAADLLPGDLVFWSSNGRVSGIHHVAVYVGAGNVVQAPQSGDIVRVTPLGSVDSGYFGATRPLT